VSEYAGRVEERGDEVSKCTTCGKSGVIAGRDILCPDCKAQGRSDRHHAENLCRKCGWRPASPMQTICAHCATLARANSAQARSDKPAAQGEGEG
jgi:hypothetical protein